MIYTSGSTGNPKGVMIEHGSLAAFAETAVAEYAIGPADRVLQFGSLSFDLSAEEIYPALIRGATVVLRPDDMINSARDFLRACDESRLTVLDLPTAYWHELTDALGEENLSLPANLRLVIIGGERASLDRVCHWQRLAPPGVRLVNTSADVASFDVFVNFSKQVSNLAANTASGSRVTEIFSGFSMLRVARSKAFAAECRFPEP